MCDKAKKRLWLAAPYISNISTVRRIVGNAWLQNSDLDVRLLLDLEDRAFLDLDTVRHFIRRGEVRTLRGLHAKIYVSDDDVIVGSANLTLTAFTRRYEVGVRLGGPAAQKLVDIYAAWWAIPGNGIEEGLLATLAPQAKPPASGGKDDHGGSGLRALWTMPDDPGGEEYVRREYRCYEAFLQFYKDMAGAYSKTQRLWPSAPLYLETDMFLNYLFHERRGRPSFRYAKRGARRTVSAQARHATIAFLAKQFAKDPDRGPVDTWMRKKVEDSKVIRRLLSPQGIASLDRAGVERVVGAFHGLGAVAIARTKFLNASNNNLTSIRESWNALLHGSGALSARMSRVALFSFGPASIQELVGLYWPETYPLRNGNVDAGLRYLGYPVPV